MSSTVLNEKYKRPDNYLIELSVNEIDAMPNDTLFYIRILSSNDNEYYIPLRKIGSFYEKHEPNPIHMFNIKILNDDPSLDRTVSYSLSLLKIMSSNHNIFLPIDLSNSIHLNRFVSKINDRVEPLRDPEQYKRPDGTDIYRKREFPNNNKIYYLYIYSYRHSIHYFFPFVQYRIGVSPFYEEIIFIKFISNEFVVPVIVDLNDFIGYVDRSQILVQNESTGLLASSSELAMPREKSTKTFQMPTIHEDGSSSIPPMPPRGSYAPSSSIPPMPSYGSRVSYASSSSIPPMPSYGSHGSYASSSGTIGPTKNAFVFDFDCTITSKHFFYFTHDYETFKKMYPYVSYPTNETDTNETDMINMIMGGEERIRLIKNMINTLVSKNCEVHIASRGVKKDIIEFLKKIGIINIADDHITGGETPKIEVLQKLIATKNVFYADDDKDEHSLFVENNHCIAKIINEKLVGCNIGSKKYIFMDGLLKNGLGIELSDMPTIYDFVYNLFEGIEINDVFKNELAGGHNSMYKYKFIKYNTKNINNLA
jgi:hypothetical protein